MGRILAEIEAGREPTSDDVRRLEELEAGIAEVAREDPDVFCAFVFGVRQAPFHREWQDAMGRHPRLLIVSPRNHGKTTQVTARCLWEVGRNPNIRIKIVAQSDNKAVERLFQIREMLERDPRVAQVFPGLRQGTTGDWTKHKIVVDRKVSSKDATIEAIGVTATATGGRADLLIFDDVVDLRSAIQMPQMREMVKQIFRSVWTNMLEPGGRAIYVCTLWHQCLPGDQRVLTARGRIPVDGLTSADILRVGPGKWEMPIAVARKEFDGNIVEFRVAGQPDVYRMTANHRIPTTAGVRLAGDLREGDEPVLHVGPCDIMGDGELLALEPVEDAPRRDPEPTMRRVRRAPVKLSKEDLAADLAVGLTYGEIARKRGVSGKTFVMWLVKRYGLARRSARNRATPGWILKPEFWRFMGYWVAEGNHDDSNDSTRLIFGHSEEERGFAADAAECIRVAFGIEPRIVPVPHATKVVFSCRIVRDWIRAWFGGTQPGRMLPPWFERIPDGFAREFVRGYWIGDGSATSCGVRFSTCSPDLACDLVRVLAVRFGIASRRYRAPGIVGPKTGRRHHPRNEVRISYADGFALGLPVRDAVQKHEPIRLGVDDGVARHPIVEIRLVPYSGWVYDVQTSTGWFDLDGITSHNSDLTHDLLRNPEWRVLRRDVGTPADPFAPLWPEKWPREELMKRCAEIGEREFARAFRNVALSDDETLIPRAILERCIDRSGARAFGAYPREWTVYTGVDLAIGKRKTSAWTVVFAIAIDDRGRRWPVDVRRQRFSSPETARQVIDVVRMHSPTAVNVESNAYQEALCQWIKELENEARGIVVPLQSFTTGANRADPSVGLPSMRVEFENGGWVICMGVDCHPPDCACGLCGWGHGVECECAICEWLTEIASYPIAQFTDALMASWFAREAARVGGFGAASACMDASRPGSRGGMGVVDGGAIAGLGGTGGDADGIVRPGISGSTSPLRPRLGLGLLGVAGAGSVRGVGAIASGMSGGMAGHAAGVTANFMGGMMRRRSSVFDRAFEDSLAPVRAGERREAALKVVLEQGVLGFAHVAPADWPAVRDDLTAMVRAERAPGGNPERAAALLALVAEGTLKFGG